MKRKRGFLSAYSINTFGRMKRGFEVYRQCGEMADKIQKFKQCLAFYQNSYIKNGKSMIKMNNKPVSEIAHEQDDETLADIAHHSCIIKSLTLCAVRYDANRRRISRYYHKDEFDF